MGDLDSIIQIIDDRIDNSDFGAEEEIEEVLQALIAHYSEEYGEEVIKGMLEKFT